MQLTETPVQRGDTSTQYLVSQDAQPVEAKCEPE